MTVYRRKEMKKAFLTAVLMAGATFFDAKAQMPYIEEVRALGSVAGQGLACGASKYDTFELLARAILISKAPGDSVQAQGMYAYNEEKANAYMSKQFDGFYECAEINRRFDNQGIFQAVLYADGTIKMPDGKIITPRQPYDASQIYQKNDKIREDLKAIYNGSDKTKIGEIKIKPTGNEGDIQTVYKPDSAVVQPQSANLPTARDVAPIPSVTASKPVSTAATASEDSSIRHIKAKW